MSSSGASGNLQLMSKLEYIPTRTADGTLVLRAVFLGPWERLRRWLKA
jgi:hypothetical protein